MRRKFFGDDGLRVLLNDLKAWLQNYTACQGAWDKTVTYRKNDIVTYYDRFLISLANNNLNHTPNANATKDTWWQHMSFYACQMPVSYTTNPIYLTGAVTQGNGSLEGRYKDPSVYIKDSRLHDVRGQLMPYPGDGTTGQVLTKTGADTAAWRTPEGGGSGGSGIKRMLLDDMSISRIGMDETTGLYGLYFPAAIFGVASAAEIVQSYLYHDLTVLSDELPSSPIMYYSLEAVVDANILFQPAQIPPDMVQSFDGEDYIPVILDARGEEFMATLQALINGLIITYSDNIETVTPAASMQTLGVQTMGGFKAGMQSMSAQTQPVLPAFLQRMIDRINGGGGSL